MSLERPRRHTCAILLTALAGLALASGAAADVTIHCLDVGQGDATLVVSSSGQTLLFDGGNNGKGTGVVVPYLSSLGFGPVDYMVASHYHADHIGGLDEVYSARGVNVAVYDRGWSYTTATYTSYAATVAAKRQSIVDGQVIDLGDGVTVTCVALNGNGVLGAPFDDEENDYCVSLHVECGDFDFFAAGDLSGVTNSYYTDIESSVAPEVGELEVYRVDHHGSYSSSNATLLSIMQPEVSIISVGSNSYGHPEQGVLDRLVTYGSYVYQTEAGDGGTLPPADLTVVNGHIVISTDGTGTYTVNGDVWNMDEPDLSPVPLAADFSVLGNFPNPFNPVTQIAFASARGGPVSLTIYDLAGRRIHAQRFVAAPGSQTVTWRGVDERGAPAPSGIYVYRLESAEGIGSGRMTLLK